MVELLVVISIIGMLMALLLPAVQQAREAGRRNTCSNNMRQLALAMTNFNSSRGAYPGYVEPLSLTTPNSGASGGSNLSYVYPTSWIVPILPLIERTDVYTLWRTYGNNAWGLSGVQNWPPGGTQPAQDPPPVYMDVLNCPSSPPSTTTSNTPCVYVANAGMMDVQANGTYPADWQANGVFFNHFMPPGQGNAAGATTPLGNGIAKTVPNPGPLVSTSQDYITVHDGSSLTLMLSENNNAPGAQINGSAAAGVNYINGIQSATPGSGYWGTGTAVSTPYMFATEPQNCFVWWPDMQPNAAMKMNAPAAAYSGATNPGGVWNYAMHPNSNHPTGVNVSFCDTHTRFISQDIDYSVYCLLMTPWGQMCNTPGSPALDTGAAANGSVYYPSGSNNYFLLRNKPIDESQIN